MKVHCLLPHAFFPMVSLLSFLSLFIHFKTFSFAQRCVLFPFTFYLESCVLIVGFNSATPTARATATADTLIQTSEKVLFLYLNPPTMYMSIKLNKHVDTSQVN